MSFIWEFRLKSPFSNYVSSSLWLVFGFLGTHCNSVIAPLWRSYRDARNYQVVDHYDFNKVLANPILFAQFSQFSVTTFTSEHTRFLGDYQLLKVMTMEAFKSDEEGAQRTRDRRQTMLPNSVKSNYAGLYDLPSVADSIISSLPRPVNKQNTSAISSISSVSTDSTGPNLEVPASLKPSFYSFYSLFIQRDSALEVNVSAEIKERVQRQIEEDDYTLTMFDAVKREVLDLLFFDTFVKFAAERPDLIKKERDQQLGQDKDDILLVNI
ncbi:hypothetical protein BC938DRAFT_472589 [Jimgerdemannia flammicorona]|uniref:RGS domain-containing protein n=1 Tax=Jimgerdemannia flammicorona TaxID=994334 RepID=A0A433Q5T3_9FUNG|nr:hypothetical protein BC938DRAFT_472589 [Jimgerdemannia flammicorona]